MQKRAKNMVLTSKNSYSKGGDKVYTSMYTQKIYRIEDFLTVNALAVGKEGGRAWNSLQKKMGIELLSLEISS